MLEVVCKGTPFEIGYMHGQSCSDLVAGSVVFTKLLSTNKSRKSWNEIRDIAREFSDSIQEQWPRYHEELRGLAKGAQCDVLDIVALNVRTEIAFGLALEQRDGCTNAWSRTPDGALQGQNWDWLLSQKSNLVRLTIQQTGLPEIKIITEAGMIGKIGLNSAGVGVTYNALYIKGTNVKGLPSHLAMRMALESLSAVDACAKIGAQGGMASSGYVLVGDASTARGIEFSSHGIKLQEPDFGGSIAHTNHTVLKHDSGLVGEEKYPLDSIKRFDRIRELLGGFEGGIEQFSGFWKDEQDYPTSICRKYKEGQSLGETLFSIVIDLAKKEALIKVGRPTNPDDLFVLDFEG